MREQPLKHGSRIRIKICGLTRPEDIQAVNQAKPDFAGFIVEFPKRQKKRHRGAIEGSPGRTG